MAGRVWYARDANLTADPKVELLGCEFGAQGILAFEEVLAVAKLGGEGGRAMMAYSQLARRALLKPAKNAPLIVERMVDLGLIHLEAADPQGFSFRVHQWTRWNDPKAAERKAAQRARENGEVT